MLRWTRALARFESRRNVIHAAQIAPLTTEAAVTETERETAGAVRSAHVAHFFSPDWAQTAQRASGALERSDRELAAPQLVVTVPDAISAVALARELRALPATVGLRVVPVTNATRGARLIKSAPPQVVVGTPAILAELLAASALKLGDVHTLLLAGADEYDAQAEPLGALMAELPRGSARILTAGAPTQLVENLLERYLHKARRVAVPVSAPIPIAPGTPPTIYVRAVSSGSALAPLGELLDDIDPPSAAIVVTDARGEGQARTALEALGYPADSDLITISRGAVTLHTALVVFVGLPEADSLTAALSAHPARLVALVAPRQQAALRELTKGVVLMPYERSRAARAAREREENNRNALRAVLAAGLPAREIVALEPLLTDHDGLEIAGAALRLYERAAEEAATAKMAGREELRAELKAARAEPKKDAAPDARPPRSFDRDKPRGERSRSGPPADRERSFGGPPRGERSFGGPPRGERSFGGPPRGEKSFGSRDERPAAKSGDRPFTRGARVDRGPSTSSRSSGPPSRGPKRDDKGRPPRREK
jgi:hypothetical protein